jgi:hypothetical protein
MNGALSDSSTFLGDALRGGDLPAGVGVGDAETIAAISNSSALTFGIIVFMYVTFLVVRCCVELDCSMLACRRHTPVGTVAARLGYFSHN